MNTTPVLIKFQQIRSCSQCGESLSEKCSKCAKHPDRKPRVIELYNYPAPIKIAECGCCILIRCGRAKCVKTFWRNVTAKNKERLSVSRSLFCSNECVCLAMSESRTTRVVVPCGWHLCNNKVERKVSVIKTFRRAFCRPDHHKMTLRKEKLDADQGLKARALLYCEKCKDVTEHNSTNIYSAACLVCKTNRNAAVARNPSRRPTGASA